MDKSKHSGLSFRSRLDSGDFVLRTSRTGFVPGGKRAKLLLGAWGVILLMLVGRLFFLQVVKGDYYVGISEENRIRLLNLPASRGQITDREGRIIAASRPSYTAFLIPYQVMEALPQRNSTLPEQSMASLTHKLAVSLELDSSYLEQKLKSGWWTGYEPIKLKKDIDFQTVCIIEEQNEDLPGVIYQVEPTRKYLEAGWVGHVVGYVNELSKKELNQASSQQGFRLGGVIGRKGLEKQYDDMLRGSDGTTFLEVTARGKILGPLREKEPDPPINGWDLGLTIDLDLQATAESALVDFQSGAVVALDPHGGGILALVSKPGVDANLFTGSMSPEQWNDILQDPLHPLLTRPIQATYPPGSTLKLLTAAIALETGLATENTTFAPCDGSFTFGKREFRCWQPAGHGRLNLKDAIIQSCDIYFYQLGLKVGLEKWSRYARLCGFGQRTGVDLPDEAKGFVPDLDYYRRKYGKGDWVKGLVINLSIGQGEVLVTPLQLAVFYAGLATDGRLMRPYLVAKRVTSDGRILSSQPEVTGYLPFSPSTLHILQEAMTGAVNDPHGTGSLAKIPDITVGGKTGTAQNPHGQDHAWFVGYAPASDPRIVVAVLVENVGHGGTFAAPVARAVMERYLKGAPPAAPQYVLQPAAADSSAQTGLVKEPGEAR
jgi:penicillin-binding protein 2